MMNCEGEDNNGHAIEGDTNGQGLFEGCVFKDVKQTVVDDFKGHLFSVGSTSVSDHGIQDNPSTEVLCKTGLFCANHLLTAGAEGYEELLQAVSGPQLR